MNTSPLISVIIPVYNTIDVIKRTLKSVENQTYQNYQIIIIDDGSTDGTSQFIDKYKKKNNKCIVFHQSNGGVSEARNKGILCSTGEFICFLDSDDTYSPTFLEKLLLRQQQTNSNIVYCGFYRLRKNNIVKEVFSFEEGNVVKCFIEKCWHLSGMLFRRSFLIENKIVFDSELKVCEDIFFTIKAISNSDVVAVKDHLFNYLYRDKSVTNSTVKIKLYKEDIESWLRIQFFINHNYYQEDKIVIEQLIRLIVVKLKVKLMVEYLKTFNYKQIKNYLNGDLEFAKEVITFNKKFFRKSEQKKLKIIKSNNLMIWFLGSLYYRYIRHD